MNEQDKEKIIRIDNKFDNQEKINLGGLLSNIYSSFAMNLKPKYLAYFETLDDTLFDLSEKTDSNAKQTLYFDAMLTIRKARQKMFKTFFSNIKSSFNSFKKNDFDYFKSDIGYNPKIKSLSLSLIDENDLDETLAKTNLINKSEMAYHKHLFALEKRFSVLASGSKIKTTQLPIGPHVIVNSFARSIDDDLYEVKIKLIMYKIFERSVMGNLNDIYNQSNDLFVTKGIIPTIVYSLNRQGQQPSISNSNLEDEHKATEYAEDNNTTEQNQPQAQAQAQNNSIGNQVNHDQNYQLINELFTHNHQLTEQNQSPPIPNRSGGHTGNGMNVPMANIDIGSMLNALSILQSDIFNNAKLSEQQNKTPTEIKDALIKQLHKLDENSVDKRVKQQDEDTIDLVGMLFQFIVDDRNLPETIQVILAKLQIPYLKIALEDRNLFADKAHPARVLLDKLSLASVGWSKESDHKMLFLSKIESITFEILEMDEYNPEKYQQLQQDFVKFLAKRKKKSDVVQKRTLEKNLGQDKINQAKETSAKLLVEKMTNKQMPILIRDILLGEWSSVLNLTFLRNSPESLDYKEKVAFIDKIIALSTNSTDSKVSKEAIINLSKSYANGLTLVAFNPKESLDKQHELVECLMGIHGLANEENSSNQDFEIIPPEEILKLSEIKKQEHEIVNYIEDIIDPKEEIDTSDIKDRYITVVKNLKTGVWLEFLRENKPAIRAKLSWISPITGKYLFVNSRGLKITDKTIPSLAKGLQDKNIKVLQQVAIFDRALSAIATKLKKESLHD